MVRLQYLPSPRLSIFRKYMFSTFEKLVVQQENAHGDHAVYYSESMGLIWDWIEMYLMNEVHLGLFNWDHYDFVSNNKLKLNPCVYAAVVSMDSRDWVSWPSSDLGQSVADTKSILTSFLHICFCWSSKANVNQMRFSLLKGGSE